MQLQAVQNGGAELAGRDARQVLAEAVARRDLDEIDDIAAVINSLIRRAGVLVPTSRPSPRSPRRRRSWNGSPSGTWTGNPAADHRAPARLSADDGLSRLVGSAIRP
jgi:hypothetical protein